MLGIYLEAQLSYAYKNIFQKKWNVRLFHMFKREIFLENLH